MSRIEVLDYSSDQGSSNWLPRFLRPPPPAPALTDAKEIARQFAYFRPRILLWTTIGYGMFYFVRRNYDAVMPVIGHQLGISKTTLGLILTIHGVLYGVSKFINGIFADRANARMFMASALIVCAGINIIFGLSSAVVVFALLWLINGWFQGMGYPPSARLLTHWFAPRELATKMSIWNASHSLGGAAILILCGVIVKYTGSWRLCFWIPACLALATAGLLLVYLRDTPESIGLPEVEGTTAVNALEANAGRSTAEFKAFLRQKVFGNKYIWIASIANFFVYTIRFSVFSWGTFVLAEYKGIKLYNAAWMVAAFEVGGWPGALVTGWLTDRLFGGRGAPLSLVCMILCGVSLFLLWKTPGHYVWLNTALLMSTGFFIYGPQALVAVIVAHLATKRGAATAVGLTSIFGYASTVASGWGLGYLVQNYGWNPAFKCLIGIAAIGALLFAMALPAKSHGQGA
jgi:OPA family glycerol-3-phosphate transporter-like MFS transporter/OPA family sugar phosphate sensor protein UhpC-like MFS transporter